MRTKFCFLALSLFLFTFSAQAQREETVLGSRSLGFSGVWGGSKHQLTRFGNTNNYVNGWHFGLEFGKALEIGMAGYNVHDVINWNNQPNQQFDMKWKGLHLGYGLQNYRAVHPLFNVDLGGGKVKYEGEGEDRIFVIQPSAGIEINIFRWFHLGLEGGYRFVTDSDISLSDRQLSGAFGQATLKFGFSWGRYRKSTSNN
ncbi:MAG: hypothetical protein EP344_07480 [Bacteroidetes bacterium]|nr:MAG: hypothetical protein EP344_07480 [Bacteroidota bacterium]